MKYVLQFTKKGRLAYISHLDLQRLFLRVFRMAGIYPAYSNGFNPHPKLSLTLPLSTGFSSDCEYLEVETQAPVTDTEAAAARLRTCLPEGIGLLHMTEWTGSKSQASLVRFAEYEITAPAIADSETRIAEYMREPSILVSKQSRKSGRPSRIDIPPMIRSFVCVHALKQTMVFRCILAAGGDGNLNPLTLIASFCEFCGQPPDIAETEVLRTRILFACSPAIPCNGTSAPKSLLTEP
ncbi:MAG: TIGR03936 family radical SAM-associated protein [Clostridiales Family XIII bacterium]|jgi:radical SAM-linked protein|nr:TIGR03936 family radical SAM-associated protein [Clostridiales Family XIII bacterium]